MTIIKLIVVDYNKIDYNNNKIIIRLTIIIIIIK